MAQEATGEQTEQNKAKRGIFPGQKLLILGIGAIVVCGLVALIVSFIVTRQNPGNPARTNYTDQAKNDLSQIGPLFEAGEFTTNLAPGGEKRFVKVKIVFELSQESLAKEIKRKLPVLRDRIFLFLNSKTSDDLSAEKRPNLKNEILKDLNRHLNTGEIMNIYFSDLVMQ